jgi:hypothetical protein
MQLKIAEKIVHYTNREGLDSCFRRNDEVK